MNFKSHSQAGQDRLAFELIGESGTFLDIGANHPVEISNTYALEQMGWHGILVENDANCVKLLREQRAFESIVINADATKIHWREWVSGQWNFDYLSLDVDEASLTVLKLLMESGLRFKVLTVEHDAYRFGTARRDEMVMTLEKHGYKVLCRDVCDQGMPFEIWAVDPLTVDMAKADKFRRYEQTDWRNFWK